MTVITIYVELSYGMDIPLSSGNFSDALLTLIRSGLDGSEGLRVEICANMFFPVIHAHCLSLKAFVSSGLNGHTAVG